MDEKVLKWLNRARKAQRVYTYCNDVKTKAVETKQKMVPIVENMKEGMRIGQGVGKVLNDEVTRTDVKWVFKQAQNRFMTRLERVISETAKTRSEKE